MLRNGSKLKQTGDTIVEVLLSMAVIGFVLGGSFRVVNELLLNERQAQERNEAVQLVQSQLEALRGCAVNVNCTVGGPLGPIYNLTAISSFCIYSATQIITPGGNPDDCALDSSGNITNVEPVYHLSINPSTISGGYLVFTARAVWNQVGGGGKDSVVVAYKVY